MFCVSNADVSLDKLLKSHFLRFRISIYRKIYFRMNTLKASLKLEIEYVNYYSRCS